MMELKQQNLLLFTRTMRTGGTENVVLQLCKIFQPLVGRVIVCSCGGVHVATLESMGITHYEIPDIENKSPKTILTVLKTVRRILREEKITVVHTHHRMAAFYTRLLYNGKFTFFNTSHNTFADKRALTRFAYQKAHLIACGGMVAKNLKEVYGMEKVKVIHNAVEPFEGTVIPDAALASLREEGCTLVGNVGRLSEQKGMSYFLRAIPKVLERFPKARFVIIGDGEDREALEALAKELGIEGDLLFLGYRSDVQSIMSQLDFVVLSSLWEGFPLTPIEAFSVGKTVVATAVDGTVEIVRDGENGLLCKPADEKDLAEKMIGMLEHPDERETMEKNARASYGEEFSFEKLSQNYIEHYLEKIDERAQ